MERCKDCDSYNIAVFEECQMGECKEPARFVDDCHMSFCIKHIEERVKSFGEYKQFCPNCYKKLNSSDQYCKVCGEELITKGREKNKWE